MKEQEERLKQIIKEKEENLKKAAEEFEKQKKILEKNGWDMKE